MLDFSDVKIGSKKVNSIMEEISFKDIAVIGIGVKLSKAETPDELWYNFQNGVDCIREIPKERKSDIDDYLSYVNKEATEKELGEAAFIKEIDKFDYSFFKLSPKEASLMDPNQRLFLEVAWKSIEDAGYAGKRIKDTNTGVFLGYGADCDYKEMISKVEPQSISVAAVGNLRPVIASRISYILNLKGPTMLIDTACSSSMVAVHFACKSLRTGECDMAIAGGMQLHILPIKQTDIGTSSSDGRTKTFDADSNGTGTGEGVIAVMLKPLGKAIIDRDNIYAIIKGSAINSDGSSLGLTAPNASAQESVILKAWEDANINPETISYIETHGTGTRLGDPIEIEGIKKAFRRFTPRNGFCAVAAAKSNYGHLDSAAGILGLVKAVLSLKHKTIPKTLHFKKANTEIDFIDSPVYVADKTIEWSCLGDKRRCGVSSFGISGTNSHIILEEAPNLQKDNILPTCSTSIFTVSARSEKVLKALVYEYLNYLGNHKDEDFHDICYTANTGRDHYNCRLSILSDSLEDLKTKLNLFMNDDLGNPQESHVYYGIHYMIDEGRTKASEFDYTDKDIQELTKEAKIKIEEFIAKSTIKKQLLREIAGLYINGADIDWDMMYVGENRRKISLSTYPFEKNRCWIDIPQISNNKEQDSDIFYENIWIQGEIPNETVGSLDGSTILVLGERGQFYDRIVQGLQDSDSKLIQVFKGSRFQKTGRDSYECINTQEGYERLLEVLTHETITHVLYLPSFETDTVTVGLDALENELNHGVYAFFRFAKALAERFCGQRIEFIFLTRPVNRITGYEKCIYPEDAALMGLFMVLPFEYPGFSSRCIDVDNNTPYESILNEIRSPKQYFKIAYRNGKRYVEQLQSIPKSLSPNNDVCIKDSGTYVITGGLGDIGTKLAIHLAEKNNVDIILVGRTRLPAREYWQDIISEGKNSVLIGKLETMQRLESIGENIIYYTADISVESQISEVLKDVRDKYGSINGIIHCAGVGANMEGKIIGEETESVFREVLLPKVQGTWILDQLTRKDELDFFIMFSSAITLVGGIGSSHYTAANCYMDAFSLQRGTSGTRYIALDWAPWYRSDSIADKKTFEEKHVFRILPLARALRGFDEAICLDLNKVIIGELNANASIFKLEDVLPFSLSQELKQKLNGQKKKKESTTVTKCIKEVSLLGKSSGVYSITERKIAGIWGHILGYEQVNIYDNFFEMGGDSILATKMHELMQQEFSQKVSVADIFAYPTISKMAEYLSNLESNEKNKGLILDTNESKNINEDIFDLFEMVSKGEMSIDNALDHLNSMEDKNE